MKILLLRLESPLMAFGGVAVDSLGVIDELPSASLLTGLLGNALGYRRIDTASLQSLQNRLRYAVRVDRSGRRITDYQTADLNKDDSGWTTRGVPEGRAGGQGTYEGQHQRYRDYHADAATTVALTLDSEDESPALELLAEALDSPARPLFVGRKNCLPSERIVIDIVEEASLLDALHKTPLAEDADATPRYFIRQSGPGDARSISVHGLRNWQANVHQGRETWLVSELGKGDE